MSARFREPKFSVLPSQFNQSRMERSPKNVRLPELLAPLGTQEKAGCPGADIFLEHCRHGRMEIDLATIIRARPGGLEVVVDLPLPSFVLDLDEGAIGGDVLESIPSASPNRNPAAVSPIVFAYVAFS
jgi:hypothetical protein